MKIIQTKLKDMPSSLLAELGSYRYNVFARGEGWSIPSRLNTPGQEYDRFDRSDVIWLIAWQAQYGICGCARLMQWQAPATGPEMENREKRGKAPAPVWEMSRFSARLDIDEELPLSILWHGVQLAEQSGIESLYSAATPMLEQMFEQNHVVYEPLSAGVIQSEDNLFAVRIPVSQPQLAGKFQGARRFSPEEVLPTLGVSVSWNSRSR
ncbi:autoinducer synthase [Erwinia typographi]|uniref:Acyl-homoserine-lactone synthase n=1 Tax=Erwinia typographi TaxID=371042 RepID=A0A0A3Z579_9GAMM|nr:acyl-homoserine-lactone synthase [Erwinia typographi]KGT94247.1 autoinducer synthase [Erwinia typographi]